MNFATSGSGVSSNTKAVSVSGSNGLNFKGSTGVFVGNISSVSVDKVNQIYDTYEEIDYSQETSDESVSANTIRESGGVDTNSSTEPKFTKEEKFLIDKGINTAGWAATKWVATDLLVPLAEGSSGFVNLLGLIGVASIEGIYKSGLKFGSSSILNKNWSFGQEFSKGFVKSFASTWPKKKAIIVKKISEVPWVQEHVHADSLKKIASKAKSNTFTNSVSNLTNAVKSSKISTCLSNVTNNVKSSKLFTKIDDFANTSVKNVGKSGKGFKWMKNYKPSTVTTVKYSSIVSDLKLTIGIDFAASIASNIVGGFFDKDGEVTGFSVTNLEVRDLKLGSTFLKSTTKTICAKAGEIAFGKTGKIVGTVVGSYLGELQVDAFKDENGNVQEGWCAAAGAAELTGAVAGGGAAIAICVALGSNPVGWAVGLGIIAGAAIGYGAVFLAHKLWG